MVTLITEQLHKQCLEEPCHKSFSFSGKGSMPAVGSSPTLWNAYRTTQATSTATHPSSNNQLLEAHSELDSLWHSSQIEEHLSRKEFSSPLIPNEAFHNCPLPPPAKRHCRSLSVPEDLSGCSSTWYPSSSNVWTHIKDGQSRGTSSLSSGAGSLPLCGPSSSLTSSLYSPCSPTFHSLSRSSYSPLPWSFSWDPCDTVKVASSPSFTTHSSSGVSLAPLVPNSVLHRCFSVSPVNVEGSVVLLSPRRQSSGCSATVHTSQYSTSACSTPSSPQRDMHLLLPRCRSQPCDMRRPCLKRSHDPDVLPCSRPGLDFSKMTQVGNCGTGDTMFPEPSLEEVRSFISSAEFLGRASTEPQSEDEEDSVKRLVMRTEDKNVIDRDCAELDLKLIEQN